ncbi:Hypothetical predicted protein [Paramuricea clavata]|uniref:Uncharacterized protein n=1 Tax=Paramuricea clavata TaxID=317549 RepID=A0A6S7HIX6_PARCT|nr:Hypothetical predicted protein [Paramuricea clavata]
MDLVSLVNEYDCLHTILDNHAPIKSREITLRPKAPWYTNEINDKKRIRRQLERKWHKTRTNADWNRYKQQCYAVNKLIDSSKSAYYTDLINNGSSDQKTLFKTVSNLLHTNTIIRYPSSPDPMSLSNSFSDFFTQKIVKIRDDIDDELLSKNIENPIPDADSCPYEFHTFREVGKDEVLHLIQRIATKSCSLDPLPVVMLNHCFKDILPVVARIINLFLESGTMPDSLKIAVVQPLLKKYNLSYEEFCSFRPISNLKFVSKSIEKAVAVQLTDYLTENHLHEKFQCAYKPCHSTETALLRVQNDILQALDNGDSVILVLLDLSAAFDTVDRLMLLTRLSKRFGIRGRVLDWLTSYLTSRKLFIRVEGTDSLLSDLDCGVPQGSVLGPLLYSLYTAPLADVARRHNLRFHFFSDDGQLYIAFKTNDRDDLISSKIRIKGDDIVILSPYRAQCFEITKKLKQHNLNDISVMSVVAAQGSEKNYVILSLVRSVPEREIERNPSRSWLMEHLGFLTDEHQINVALTRAKRGLCIVGNANLLGICSMWRELLKHYESKGCLKMDA